MTELFANSGDPDQTPRSAASDLALHCLYPDYNGLRGIVTHCRGSYSECFGSLLKRIYTLPPLRTESFFFA